MPNLPLHTMLDAAGLNQQHVFDLADLPADLLQPLSPRPTENRLILFGNAGRRLWDCVQSEGMHGAHPIDDYSVRTVQAWLKQALPSASARFVYPFGLPAGKHVGLQRLGRLAGWHHSAPFMVGVHASWGSWFAYRAAILMESELPPSVADDLGHPCLGCDSKACISACLGRALDTGSMHMAACHQQRLQHGSPCAMACAARQACPVGAAHRYDDGQIRYGAAVSLAAIRQISWSPP